MVIALIVNFLNIILQYLTVADRLVLDQLKELGILQQPATQRNIIQAKRAELQQAASGVKGSALI